MVSCEKDAFEENASKELTVPKPSLYRSHPASRSCLPCVNALDKGTIPLAGPRVVGGQRLLARDRFVDHDRVTDAAQEGGVGRRRDAAGERQLGAHQVGRRLVVRHGVVGVCLVG